MFPQTNIHARIALSPTNRATHTSHISPQSTQYSLRKWSELLVGFVYFSTKCFRSIKFCFFFLRSFSPGRAYIIVITPHPENPTQNVSVWHTHIHSSHTDSIQFSLLMFKFSNSILFSLDRLSYCIYTFCLLPFYERILRYRAWLNCECEIAKI